MVVRSDVLIGSRYLAIRGAKQKAQIGPRQRKMCRRTMSAATHCRKEASRPPKWLWLSPQSESTLSLQRARPTSKCLGVCSRAIIPSPRKRFHHEQTGSDRIRGLLRELYIESSGVRCIERPRIATPADAAVVCGAKRAGRKFPVCAGEMDGKGSSRTHHRYRTHFYVPGIAVCAQRPNAASRIRAG